VEKKETHRSRIDDILLLLPQEPLQRLPSSSHPHLLLLLRRRSLGLILLVLVHSVVLLRRVLERVVRSETFDSRKFGEGSGFGSRDDVVGDSFAWSETSDGSGIHGDEIGLDLDSRKGERDGGQRKEGRETRFAKQVETT